MMPNEARSIFFALWRWLAGPDVFISYARADGISYAEGLAADLTAKGLACRVDLWETTPGGEPPRSLKRAVRLSKMLVIVATEGAARSPHVKWEIEEFLQTRGMVVPVAFGTAFPPSSWRDLLTGLPIAYDPDPDALTTGKPAEQVVNRIENAVTFMRRNRRLRNMALVSAGVFVALLSLSAVYSKRAKQARAEAVKQGQLAAEVSAKATRQIADADLKTRQANEGAALQQQRAEAARKTTQMELAGTSVINQFDNGSSELDALGRAVTLGDQLAQAVPAVMTISDYPALSPVAALNHILLNVREAKKLNTHGRPIRGTALDGNAHLAILEGDMYANGCTRLDLLTRNGRELKSWPVGEGGASAVKFTPENDGIVTATGRGVQFWGLDGTLRKEWLKASAFEMGPARSRLLAILQFLNPALLFNLDTGHTVELKPTPEGISELHFQPGAGLIVTSGNGHSLYQYDLEGNKKKFFEAEFGYPEHFAFNADGTYLCAVFGDMTYAIEVKSGSEKARWDSKASRAGPVANPKESGFATIDRNGVVQYWNELGRLNAQFIGHRGGAQSVSFSPDGNEIVTTGNDGTVSVWTLTGSLLYTLHGHQGRVFFAQFSEDAKTMMTAGMDDAVKQWDLGDRSQPFAAEKLGAPLDMAPAANGGGFITVHGDAVRKWNVYRQKTGEWKIAQTSFPLQYAKISPNARRLLLVTSKAIVVATTKGHLIRQLASGKSFSPFNVVNAAFNGEATHVAVLYAGGTVEIYDLRTGAVARPKVEKFGWAYGAAFDSSGEDVWVAWADGKIRKFSAAGALVSEFDSGQRQTLDLAIGPDGTIATAGGDSTVRLFTPEGKLKTTLQGQTDRVLEVHFGSDGQSLAAMSAAGTVSVWDMKGRTIAEIPGVAGPRSHEVSGGDFGAPPVAFCDRGTIAFVTNTGELRVWPLADLPKLLALGRAWLEK